MFRSLRSLFRLPFAQLKPIRKAARTVGQPIEVFEGRIVPATIVWDSTNHPTGGSWENASFWVGGAIPGSSDDAVINLGSTGTVSISGNENVASVTTNAKTTLDVKGSGKLTLGGGNTNFGGPVTVDVSGTLNAPTGSHVAIAAYTFITVNGTLNVTSPASFTAADSAGHSGSQGIIVNGTMTATNATFSLSTGSVSYDPAVIQVKSGGHLTASNSKFHWDVVAFDNGSKLNSGDITGSEFDTTVYLPILDVPLLANNTVFQDVYLNSNGSFGTNGTIHLPVLGSSSSAQRYVFNGLDGYAGSAANFSIPSGKTVDVDAGASVLIQPYSTVVVDGALNVTSPASFAIASSASHSGSQGIVVDGSMSVSNTVFTKSTGSVSYDPSYIQVKSNGHLTSTNSTYQWDVLAFDNGSILNSGDITGNEFDTTMYIPILDVPLLTNNSLFQDIYLNSNGSFGSSTEIHLAPLGPNSSAQRYVFNGLDGYGGSAANFSIPSGKTVDVDAGASVLIQPYSKVVVDGALNVTSPASFAIASSASHSGSQGIIVDGTMAVSNAVFSMSTGSVSYDPSYIQVKSNGHLTSSNSTYQWDVLAFDNGSVLASGDITGNEFDTTMYIPVLDVPLLTGNSSFQDINLNSNSSFGSNPTLHIAPLGPNSSVERFVFPGVDGYNGTAASFTIPVGQALDIDAGSAVLIQPYALITVNGALNVANTASFAAATSASHGGSQGIVVNGAMSATNVVFTRLGSVINYDPSLLQVKTGGTLDLLGGKFGWDKALFQAGSTDTLQFNYLASQLTIDSGANVTIHQNDFTTASLVATGASGAIIDISQNYWSNAADTQIDGQITDHKDNAALPTLEYHNILTVRPVQPLGAAATTAYSGGDQNVTLTGTFTTPGASGDVNVNEGTATFTILSGVVTIGSPVTVSVVGGAASAPYLIPSGTLGGTYIIQVTYNGTSNYESYTDSSQTLTIAPVASTSIAVNTSVVANAASTTNVAIEANIQSSAGTVINGSATITILDGSMAVVGAPVSAQVLNGAVNVTYILPSGTAGGLYSIEVEYSGSESFLLSNNQSSLGVLTVNAAPVFSSVNAASFVSGNSGNFQVTVDGFPASNFTVLSGTLPNGVTLSSTGLLSGNATEYGVFNFTIQASNGIGTAVTQSFTLTVNAAPIITSTNSFTFQTTITDSFQATATGFPNPTFSETGALPAGLTFSSAGLLSGTPTQSGAFSITIHASNGIGTQADQSFTITVNDAPAFTSADNVGFLVSAGGTFQLLASGYPTPTLTLTDPLDLPTGVTFNQATGVLTVPSGTTAGVTTLSFTASNGIGVNASQNLTLTIGTLPAITTADNSTFLYGSLGTFAASATGFPTPIFSVTGTLPDGVTLDPNTGILSGTPTQDGVFSFTINATNTLGSTPQSFTLTINAEPSITTADSATFYTSATNSFLVKAFGFPAPTFSVTNGSLPAGVTLDPVTGILSGTPSQSGPFQFTITAGNGIGVDDSQIFNLNVQVGVSPVITSLNSATFASGTSQSFSFAATGNPAPVFTEVGALPAGITLASDGTLSGTTTETGTFTVLVTATNLLGTNSQTFTLTVTAPPVITSANTTTFLFNTAGSFQVAATGFPAPTFTETGVLPAGITLTSAGVLSGTPTESGSYSITITATNTVSISSQTFILIVNAAPVFTSASTTTLILNTFGSFQVTASGFPAPTFTEVGSLPAGVTLTAGGLLSGQPTQSGNFTIIITANNGIGTAPTQTFLLHVQLPVTFLPLQLPDGQIGSAYSQTITSSGPPGPYTFAVTAGSLPPGLTLTSAGAVGGTPTSTSGTYNFTITATASTLETGTHDYSIVVAAAPIPVTITGRPDGAAYQYIPNASGVLSLVSVNTAFPSPGVNVRTAVADVNGDGVPDTILVTGPGVPIRLSVLNGIDHSYLVFPIDPFGGDFTGGGFVAAGDFDGDGKAEIAVTPDQGGGPRVSIFSLIGGNPIMRANYFTLDANFRGGARVAIGDVNGDGVPDLSIVAGFGGGPRVELIDGKKALTTDGFNPADRLVNDFFAFDPSLRNGVYIAIGDVNGDGFGDLVLGGGPGGGPRVLIVSGESLLTQGPSVAIANPLSNFFLAGDTNDRGGVRVSVTDADRDAKMDVVVGTGGGQPSQARIYLGKNFIGTGEPLSYQDLNPFNNELLVDGVYVG